MPPVWTRDEPHDDFNGEPRVADAFHVEEGLVRVRLILVQRPRPRIVGSLLNNFVIRE